MCGEALTMRSMSQRYQEALRYENAWETHRLGAYTLQPYITNSRRQTGSFYTPMHIVRWLTNNTLDPALVNSRQQATSLRVMDSTCGSGRFLLCAFRRMFLFHVREIRSAEGRSAVEADVITAAAIRALASIVGRDISEDALDCARRVLTMASGLPETKIDLRLCDAATSDFTADIVLGNPPWGAEGINAATALAIGLPATNINSFIVVISRAWQAIPPGGRMGFVLPRNFLKGHDYAPVRQLLLETGQLEWVIDADRPFPGVTQEAVLVITRKLLEGERTHPVRIAGLVASSRNRALLRDEHQMDQWDFSVGPSALIAIHTEPSVITVLKQMEAAANRLRATVIWQRGLEYGQHGLLVRCQACGDYSSAPGKKRDTKACPSCGQQLLGASQTDFRLIADTQDATHTHPIYTGRLVGRYYLAPAYWLDLHVPGVRYKKSAMFNDPKVLLPKIAPSIAAACDSSGAYVTQGVYLLRPMATWNLHMLLGWLNSSAVAFYYEHRFNDQAKLTTNLVLAHLLSLPVPAFTNEAIWQKVATGAVALERAAGGIADRASMEAAVDEAVIELYGLDDEAAKIITDWRARTPVFRGRTCGNHR